MGTCDNFSRTLRVFGAGSIILPYVAVQDPNAELLEIRMQDSPQLIKSGLEEAVRGPIFKRFSSLRLMQWPKLKKRSSMVHARQVLAAESLWEYVHISMLVANS